MEASINMSWKTYNIPSTIKERNALIKQVMQRDMQGKSFYTPCLHAYISVNVRSVREAAFHASKYKRSTEYALNLPVLLQHAAVREINLPVISKRQEDMNFVTIATLICSLYNINGSDGYAKITIGQKANGRYYEYCVTAVEMA